MLNQAEVKDNLVEWLEVACRKRQLGEQANVKAVYCGI